MAAGQRSTAHKRLHEFIVRYTDALDLTHDESCRFITCGFQRQLGDFRRLDDVLQVAGHDTGELQAAMANVADAVRTLRAVAVAARDRLRQTDCLLLPPSPAAAGAAPAAAAHAKQI